MKQGDSEREGSVFATVMLTAFAICLGILCFEYLFPPWAADDGLGAVNVYRGLSFVWR